MADASKLNGVYHRALVLDAEIVKAISMPSEMQDPEIEYCHGWDDFHNMGIASVVCQTPTLYRTEVYMKDNMHGLQGALDDADLIITFNGVKFDAPLLAANGITIDDTKHYDLLREVWRAAGNDPDNFDESTHMGYGLNAMCRANGLPGKIGHGALAPYDFQQKCYGRLITYNIDDVSKLYQLVLKALINAGHLKNPTGGSDLDVLPPYIV